MEKLGKYQIIDILGKGAMGIVYRALDPDIDREVAIKTIRFDLISEESERNELMLRFVREAKAAGKMAHPNIITIFDVGKHEDMTYIVMQYIEGKSLQKYYSLADMAISRKEIQKIVERQRNAEEKKDLLAFLSDIGLEEISTKKKLDIMNLFNNYDKIQSRVSNLSIAFKDPSEADVNFSHLLVAMEKSTGKRKILFEGKKTLSLKKWGEEWKIMGYR